MALFDREIEYLENRARVMGERYSGRMLGMAMSAGGDRHIWDIVTGGLDCATWGEHPSDLDNPTTDDVKGVADAFRSTYSDEENF